jgi:type II secretory pathway pseudopilin PulG
MLVVVAILSLLVGITFPSVSAGIDSVRLASSADSVASYLNMALNHANRRQEAVEIEFLPEQRTMNLLSASPALQKSLELPTGIEFREILPPTPAPKDAPRRFIVYPGGTVPKITVDLTNARGGRRLVQIDPITGAPQIRRPGEQQGAAPR